MTGPCNLHELAEPLVRMNRELLESARGTAQKYFHCEGAAWFSQRGSVEKDIAGCRTGKLGVLAVWRGMDVPESL